MDGQGKLVKEAKIQLRGLVDLVLVGKDACIMEKVVDMGMMDMQIRVVEQDKFEVKEVATCAILNIFSGSERKQFECIKDEYFPLLDEIRHCHNDPPTVTLTVTLCSKILELDNTYHTETSSEILKPIFLPTNEEGRSSSRAHMISGDTANLVNASASHCYVYAWSRISAADARFVHD